MSFIGTFLRKKLRRKNWNLLELDPDPDPLSRKRIRIKMKRIRNTDFFPWFITPIPGEKEVG